MNEETDQKIKAAIIKLAAENRSDFYLEGNLSYLGQGLLTIYDPIILPTIKKIIQEIDYRLAITALTTTSDNSLLVNFDRFI